MRMKDKKSEQIKNKKNHRESLKAIRRTEPILERFAGKILKKPEILIVCEGKNTEPTYFRQFKLTSAKIIPIGEGYNTLSLVKRAIELSNDKMYDQVWCVFDADPKPDNLNQSKNFNKAVKLAEKKGFRVAYSNQAFEYWLILHFDDHQGGKMNRCDYNQKINQLLKPFNITYDGENNKIITEEIFEVLEGIDNKTKKQRKKLAISRAKRNCKIFNNNNIALNESSTTVYKLVEELMKYI